MPRVTVLIAAYNSAEYVRDTLASVFAQHYDDWTIVLVDDASTDDTVAIAESFGPRVEVVPQAVNSGRPAMTRAVALTHADSELVAFLDADDMWLPDYLGVMTELIGERPVQHGIGAAVCDARMLLPDGKISPRTYADVIGSADDLTVDRLLRGNPVYTSALVPRAVIEEAGGLATDLIGTDDHDLWLRVTELGYRIVPTPEPLAVYRVRPTSLSANVSAMAVQSQAVYRRALERGNLSRSQRRVASRELRLQRAVERMEGLLAARRAGKVPVGPALRSAPLFFRAAIEHLDRLPRALRSTRSGGRPYAAGLAESDVA